MTTCPALDLEKLRNWIGREGAASDVITAPFAQKFSATFDWAENGIIVGTEVPPLIHFCLCARGADPWLGRGWSPRAWRILAAGPAAATHVGGQRCPLHRTSADWADDRAKVDHQQRRDQVREDWHALFRDR